jgi:hypothetical protein
LYRLKQALARANVSISRGALSNWVIRSAELHLLRLYEALKQKLRTQPLVHGDETWVQVLKEDGRDAQSKSVTPETASPQSLPRRPPDADIEDLLPFNFSECTYREAV